MKSNGKWWKTNGKRTKIEHTLQYAITVVRNMVPAVNNSRFPIKSKFMSIKFNMKYELYEI
jgi:hypothetical protein